MTPREAELTDQKELLKLRKISIGYLWKDRHKPFQYANGSINKEGTRVLLRWLIEQAKHHKHMIAQLESLPDLKPFDFSEIEV